MSAIFIIRYAGAGVTFRSGQMEIVSDAEADTFTSEADAWYAAYQAGLSPNIVEVVCPSTLNSQP